MRLLFVCTGNICRSPTAERLAVLYGERMGFAGLQASSAGTRAVISHPIHRDASDVLEQMGGSGAGFKARQLTARIASTADLILTMTRSHREAVLELAPTKLNRTFTLPEASYLVSNFEVTEITGLSPLRARAGMLGDELDITDPIGQTPEVFAAVGAQISKLLPPILKVCLRSSEGPTRHEGPSS